MIDLHSDVFVGFLMFFIAVIFFSRGPNLPLLYSFLPRNVISLQKNEAVSNFTCRPRFTKASSTFSIVMK